MHLTAGLKILENEDGTGPISASGDTVKYDVRIFLNGGDEVYLNPATNETILGKRRVIAGIEKALTGMRAGGYRKVRISPHLAYGGAGVAESIPPAAVLYVSIWLREIVPATNS